VERGWLLSLTKDPKSGRGRELPKNRGTAQKELIVLRKGEKGLLEGKGCGKHLKTWNGQ